MKRKANRVHRGLYRCIGCKLQVNADGNGTINIIKKVAPKNVLSQINAFQWSSGEIISPKRVKLVSFVAS